MAAAIAGRGFEVVGFDIDERAVERVNAGHAPVAETGLDALIAANRERLRATTDPVDAVVSSDVSFVVVPTPSDERGAFSLEYAEAAFRSIGRALAVKDGYHLVVLTSTVLPGATRHGLIPVLEAESGKVCGRDFGFCYSPVFIALGSVIRDFLHPDSALIGEFDERSGSLLEQSYREILENGAPCQRMSLENAELTKIAVNTYITTKVTFANMLAELCERIPGGDVDVVSNALGLDARIGRKYLTGAVSYGGPCFPRDNVALKFLARAVGANAELAETTDRMNRQWAERVIARFRNLVGRGRTVAILGMAYKPGTPVTDESAGVYLARAVTRLGGRVVAYDPLAGDSARAELGAEIAVEDTLSDALREADVVMVTTPDPVFRELTAEDLSHLPEVVVIDFWRLLDGRFEGAPNVRHIAIGRSADDAENAGRLVELWAPTGSEHSLLANA